MSSAVLSKVAALLCGATMLGLGLWALFWPVSFAAWVDFPPYNEHLLHDVGAFQIGIGVTLLLAAVVRDALTVALAGFVPRARSTRSCTAPTCTSGAITTTPGGWPGWWWSPASASWPERQTSAARPARR